jgi:hypothetical protein
MEKTFKSKTDSLYLSIIGGVILFVLVITFFDFEKMQIHSEGLIFTVLVNAVIIGLLSWMFFGTHYKLSSQNLSYRCGPFYGKIEIASINKILVNETMYVGFKPATARNGLIIKYNKYDDIYISPADNDTFVQEILKLNSQIEIINSK